jgi:hypothetical protein
LNTSQPLNRLEAQLETLRAERADLAATRTREDTRKLAEDWLAAACSRMNGMAGLVLNGHANPPEIQPVIAEFLLDSPHLLAFITKKVEATTDLTNRARAAKLKKLDEQVAKLEQEELRHARAAALAEVEARFSISGDAA